MKWSFFPFGGERKCRDELISHINFSENENILDMCCGTGGSTLAILRQAGEGSEITGLDLSSGQLTIASRISELKNVSFVEGDAAATGFPDNHFDKVFITHALHEMNREMRMEVLREAGRILKENGNLIVLELDRPESVVLRIFFGFWFFYWLPFNFESATRKDMLNHGIINELSENGFSGIIRISKFGGILQTVVGVKGKFA